MSPAGTHPAPTAAPGADLAGRRVIVTGAGSGIGRATAHRAAQLGAEVAVVDIDAAAAQDTSDAINRARPSAAAPVRADVRTEQGCRDAVEAALATMGRIDGLVHTVGGAHPAPVAEMTLADWRAEIELNLDATFLATRAALPHLGAVGGSIVLTSSNYGAMPGPGRAAYAAAKAGVIAFAKALALEVAPAVRVNVLAPGATDTERFHALLGAQEVARIRASLPLGRLTAPEDQAASAAFLLSDAARGITGQVLFVNGGNYLP